MSDDKSPNPRNAFILDQIPDDDVDLEELKQLQKIKIAIRQKKKDLKQKNFDNKHPEIANLRKRMEKDKVANEVVSEAHKPAPPKETEPFKKEKTKKSQNKVVEVPKEEVKKEETRFNDAIKNTAPPSIVRATAGGSWF